MIAHYADNPFVHRGPILRYRETDSVIDSSTCLTLLAGVRHSRGDP